MRQFRGEALFHFRITATELMHSDLMVAAHLERVIGCERKHARRHDLRDGDVADLVGHIQWHRSRGFRVPISHALPAATLDSSLRYIDAFESEKMESPYRDRPKDTCGQQGYLFLLT